MKLNRELTEKLFQATTNEDVLAIINNPEYDLNEASRMALDNVLRTIYDKKCVGTKSTLIEMIKGASQGIDVPDVAVTPDINTAPPTPAKKKVVQQVTALDPEERAAKVRARIEAMVNEAPDHFVRINKFKRDAELKSFGFSEQDCKTAASHNETIVCGADSSGKLYVMYRNQTVMDELSTKYGDTYFD